MAEPLVTDIPPAALREQLVGLAKALDGEIPAGSEITSASPSTKTQGPKNRWRRR